MEAEQYARAIRQYEKAAQGQPRDGRMHKALGEALHLLSREKPVIEAYPLEQRAMEAFENAARLIPIDAEAHYGLARSTARLQEMHAFVQPAAGENPFRPLPHFQRAIELRPNGILYRYAKARYLYRIADIRAFQDTIRELVRIYPPTYSRLRREPFWSESLEQVVQEGLLKAVETNVMPRHAAMALADIMERNNKPQEALKHYTLALEHGTRENTPSQYIRLGRVQLQAGEQDNAEEAFTQALLASNSRDADLRRVLAAFRAHNNIEAFLNFFERTDRSIPFSPEARLVVAEALIETKAYPEARFLLERLNQRRPTSHAYFLLYKIASQQKDRQRMELAIQKATVLEPGNSRYHYLFSLVLRDAGDLDMAVRAATRAIEHNQGPSDRLYHYRASLRRRMNDYSGALSDWKTAISISPERAAYHAGAAEALVQLASFDKALAYSAKAAALEPGNDQYQKRHTQLKEQFGDP